MCWSARRGAHIEPTRRSAVAVTITTWPDSASTKCISACSSWRGVAEGIRRAGHFGIHQAQCPIDHANLQGARTRARREGSERPRAAMTLGAARYPLARPGMALPRRPRQSRARPHVRVEDLTEIAALSHAEVLRPVPDRQRFFERILKRSPVAHRVTCPEQTRCVWLPAPCSRCLALWHCCCPFFGSRPGRPMGMVGVLRRALQWTVGFAEGG